MLVGGPSAIEHDVRKAAARDTLVIPPIALFVVLLILIALLRAIVAPLLLIATVVLSFAASLGFSLVVFDVVFGFARHRPVVAAVRLRLPRRPGDRLQHLPDDAGPRGDPALRHAQGMLRGLAVTGAVITSAGIVLAGTFSVLAVLPLVFLTEIGFVIAFGVLLDALVVRSVLVPALVLDVGPTIWWPSRLAETDGEHREEPDEAEATLV